MTRTICDWFIEPLDAQTNEVISRELPVENADRITFTREGRTHTLWQCPFNLVSRLDKSRGSLKLRFQVYNRFGLNGRIRKCPFLPKRGRRNPQNYKKTA